MNKRRLLFTLLGGLLASHLVKAEEPFRLHAPAFSNQGMIPSRYTCEGEDIAPALQWQGLPKGTKSLVLIVDDPDAPDPRAPQTTWVHWLLYNLSPQLDGLPEGLSTPPAGAQAGRNDFQRTEYGGPCPPIGTHRYFFKLYALDQRLPDLQEPDKQRLLEAMQGHVLGKAQLIGRYRKSRP